MAKLYFDPPQAYQRKGLSMRRIVLFLILISLVLAGCGGASDTTVAAPPQSQPVEELDSPQLNEIISGWKSSVPAVLQQNQIKPETIEEQVYESTASLEEVAGHYKKLTENGWYEVRRMPGIQEGTFLPGYEIGGVTTLVVGAFDASLVGGSGVIVYTAKGSK
jgi:hypothetical protein